MSIAQKLQIDNLRHTRSNCYAHFRVHVELFHAETAFLFPIYPEFHQIKSRPHTKCSSAQRKIGRTNVH